MDDQRHEPDSLKPVPEINPIQDDAQNRPAATEPLTKNIFGLLSVICGILMAALILIAAIFIIVLEAYPLMSGGLLAPALCIVLGILICIAIIGANLGFIGLFAGNNKKRGLAQIGVTLNLLAIICLGLWTLGLMFQVF